MRLEAYQSLLVNFGIARHFVSVLNHGISKSAIYSLSFDESLNKRSQECEMDLLIRFWDETDNDVKVRYLISSFFWHGIVKNLSKQFKEITKSLVSTKVLGASKFFKSNINLKFYEALKQERNENIFLSLIDRYV